MPIDHLTWVMSQLKLPSQMTLGCIKLTSKVNKVTHLMCKCEVLSSNTQNPHKAGYWIHLYMSVIPVCLMCDGRQRQENPQTLTDSLPDKQNSEKSASPSQIRWQMRPNTRCSSLHYSGGEVRSLFCHVPNSRGTQGMPPSSIPECAM